MSDITIGFGADTADFEKGKQSVLGGFKDVENAAKKTKPALDNLGSSSPAKGLGGLADTSRQARFAMQNLNRVVSDAPFGFIAIQNNVDQAGLSFLALVRSAGGVKAALKALALSFTGLGGIISVITLASALYLAFGDDIKEAFNKGAKAAEEYKEALNKAIEASFKLEEVKIGKDATFDRETSLNNILSNLQLQKEIQKDILDLESRAAEGSSVGGTRPSGAAGLTQAEKELLQIRKDNVEELQNEIVALSIQISEYDTLFRSKTRALAGGAKPPPPDPFLLEPFATTIPGPIDVSGPKKSYEDLFDAIKDGYARALDPFDDPLPPLPKLDTKESTNAFDDYAETLVKTQRLAEKGIISSQESMQRELAFTQELLERTSNEGFPLAAEAVEMYTQKVAELTLALGLANEAQKAEDEALRAANASLDEAISTIDVFGSDAIEALAGIAVGLEKIEDIGEVVGDIIKGLARDLIVAAAKAALLTALFPSSAANAGGFKGLFKGFLGLTGISASAPGIAAPGVADAASLGTSALGPATTQKLDIKALRVGGGDLLLTIQEAQNTRGVGGVVLS